MSSDVDLKLLQEFLDNHSIPKIKRNPKTFLGIAKQPHYENVLSNIYAFYFNPNEEHKLKDLFISSLQKLIIDENASKKINIGNDFDIETEYYTKDKGRIDLLIHNDKQAIIIENKVYHHLNNNLKDYWDTVKDFGKEDESMIGIVLSLKVESNIKHSQFINITHLEFLKKVMESIGKYLLNAEDKYIVFLKDLYQNILNLSKSFMEKDDLDFYYKNQEELNEIVKLKFAVRDHIVNEVEKACNMSNLELKFLIPRNNYNSKRLCYYVSKKHKDLMFTIIYEDLLTTKRELHIIVELTGDALNNRNQYKKISFDKDKSKFINKDKFYEDTEDNWAHFASNIYELNNENIEKLSDFISGKIEDDGFSHIFSKIETFLE